VSDRLISQSATGKPVPFDANCNKAVVFCATDAHVVVAYTGRAYLDHIPTDTFIAQSLVGSDLSGHAAFIVLNGPPVRTDIGRSVERLRKNLSEAFRRLPERDRGANFQVSIMGWRQRRRNRRMTPVVWHLSREPGASDKPFVITREERCWAWDRAFKLRVIPEIPAAILESLRGELRKYGDSSPEDIKRILLEGLLRCADTRPAEISYSCIQIVLTPNASPQALVRHVPDVRQPDILESQSPGYAPWVLAPRMAYAPALMHGGPEGSGWIDHSTGYTWEYEGPLTPPEPRKRPLSSVRLLPTASQSAQPRKPDPQKRR
jgi:hypothetical protein